LHEAEGKGRGGGEIYRLIMEMKMKRIQDER
jgi:hypothetical protein